MLSYLELVGGRGVSTQIFIMGGVSHGVMGLEMIIESLVTPVLEICIYKH